VLASLIFIIPTVSVALMFSSLTSESRFAAFAWFAFWGLGFIAWNVTYGVMSAEARRSAYVEAANQAPYDPQQWLNEAVERGTLPPQLQVPPNVRLTPEQREVLEQQRRHYEEAMRAAEAFGFADPHRRQVEAQIAQAQAEIARHPMSLVSLYDTLVRLQRWVFGLETRWSTVIPSLLVTVFITLFAWVVLLRRVAAPIRV
jgi:hypothetical protein